MQTPMVDGSTPDRGGIRERRRAAFLGLALLLMAPGMACPDDHTGRVEELMGLDRAALIQMAVDEIQSHNSNNTFVRDHFDQITVTASDRSIFVDFAMSVRYVPRNSHFSYWARVDLVENTITTAAGRTVSHTSLLPGSETNLAFFAPSERTDAAALFALRRLHPDIGSVREVHLPAGSHIQIREKLLSYEVTQESPYSYSVYTVGKCLGVLRRVRHESLVPDEADGMR